MKFSEIQKELIWPNIKTKRYEIKGEYIRVYFVKNTLNPK
jgi:hypothetical protein